MKKIGFFLTSLFLSVPASASYFAIVDPAQAALDQRAADWGTVAAAVLLLIVGMTVVGIIINLVKKV